MTKVHVCLQVRSSSNRLPFKCLLPINNLESIKILIKRIKSKKYTTNILTSNNKSDDYLCDKLKNEKINIYRGNLHNVYKRYIQFANKLKESDIIVRITGDNLFVDKNIIEEIINFYKKNSYNYVSINRQKSKLPYGIAVELFNLKTLKKWKAKSLYDREHVTAKIIRNEKKCGYYIKNNNLQFYNLRCTIDNIKDYFIVKASFQKAKNIKLDYIKMCKILKSISNKEIESQKKNYSNIILGSANFGGNYGLGNKKKLNAKNLNQIFKVANEIGINQIDTADAYEGVHNKIVKNRIGKKFNIISKGIVNLDNNDLFFRQFDKTLKTFSSKNLKFFLIHNFNEYYSNTEKFKKIYKKNLKLKKRLGISIYEPHELEKMNKKIFNVIQIPFNLCDNRWTNLNCNQKIIVRSIFLQGIFFCKDKDVPVKIRLEVKKIKKKISYFIKKYKRLNAKDLLFNYVRSFNFKGIIIGVDNEKQLKELFIYSNMPKLKETQINNLKRSLQTSIDIIDPRRWN